MSHSPLKVAVVGHTNTGKTSLMRTLLRDVSFGEVSDRPAVTRDVEAALLNVEDEPMIELFDTPGLEDSISLLESLEAQGAGPRGDGLARIEAFLQSREAEERFRQEAKAVRQILASDLALYVIDAREPVLGRHRDELRIISFCARPVVPVLNFIAAAGARTGEWRESLRRLGLHAAAEFDTVIYHEADERRLFEKMRALSDSHREQIDDLLAARGSARRSIVRASCALIGEMLVDSASFVTLVHATDRAEMSEAVTRMREVIRARESSCVQTLLALHRFRSGDVEEDRIPMADWQWGLDLFSPEALRQFGICAGGAAATGAAAGLTLDIMLHGLSLGTATLAGAAIGGLLGAARTHGRRLLDRARGYSELRCNDATLRLLAARECSFLFALLSRGHAAVQPLSRTDLKATRVQHAVWRTVQRFIDHARQHPEWSSLGHRASAAGASDPARTETIQRIAAALDDLVHRGSEDANEPA